MAGRPTKLDGGVTDTVCAALARGNSRRNASLLGGITYTTFCNWMKLGRQGSEIHAAFLGRVEKAEAEAEDQSVQTIRSGQPGWQGQAWWLERRRRHGWRRPVQPVADNDKGLEGASDEELARILEQYQAERKRA